MRLRHAAASVAAGSLALLLTMSGTANAATGEFSYKYLGPTGQPHAVTLHDPASRECITLPEVADPDASEPAFAPHNDTDESVMVFTEPDCTGDSWTLRAHGRPATDRLKLRSVFFAGR
ncbi:hypothetical protein OG625_01215 [Streptomyces sp. NBC_01351]|uniref:hypothetical protein n=1 Tax=Streptomyces sp. NBC_01351 TaxID=2903833 RepID=UPI002E31B9B9|nr:hypothetical protein [Streptomyces sp. NBC_01351]